VFARDFTIPGIKAELDLVGHDGAVLAFVEVKMRSKAESGQPTTEDAINLEKRRSLARMASSIDSRSRP
jgi:Holliday junction resolvase-like predicted endonuclease